MNWTSTKDRLPPENKVVETMIADNLGVRNEADLVFFMGRFFLPDKSIYVYYTPTHWRFKNV